MIKMIRFAWTTYFFILFLVLILLWIFTGGGRYEFVGIRPLLNGEDELIRYLDPVTREQLAGVNVSKDDICPVVPELKKEPRKYRSKGEELCIEALEEFYEKEFPTVRPNFLKNPETGRNLELDGYNSELQIAVEYNGIQHYQWPNFLNQTKEDFFKQLRRDQFKKDRCDQHGVYLITVPYTVPHHEIKNYVYDRLPENFSLNYC